MSPRNWILIAIIALAPHVSLAAVAPPLALTLNIPQPSSLQRYSSAGGKACLVLETGKALGDQDAAGLQKLIADLDVHAGPGVMPEAAPAGSLLYTYSLIPELKGTRLIYRGLLSSSSGNTVRVSARGPASLSDVVERDLGFTGPVDLVFSRQCD
ncbi:MAG: hypothetical protein ACXWP1_01305 [Bdellovibrionota bacterium]